jgi:predicted restriction endonuclease
MKHGQTIILKENTSLSTTEAEEFLNNLEDLKDISIMNEDDILNEFWDNWSAHDSYQEAWEDEQTFDDEQTEEQFKEHAFILSSGRCLVRDYK